MSIKKDIFIQTLRILSVVLFVCILFTPLAWTQLFVDPVVTPKLIWFSVCTGLFVVANGTYFVITNRLQKIEFNLLDVSFLLFVLVIHLSQFFGSFTFLDTRLSVFTSAALLYIILLSFRGFDAVVLTEVFRWALVFLSFIISSIAIYQFIDSKLHGGGVGMVATMGNSGAMASYLSVTFSFSLPRYLQSKSKFEKGFYLTALAFILLSLILSHARAAWVATILSSVFCFSWLYGSEVKALVKNSKYGVAFVGLVLGLSIGFAFFIYLFKKDSTNGRLFIWKRTTELIADNPLFGTGYGAFESVYPLYQASFFAEYPNDENLNLADDISHPFNEYLYILAELGITGLVFLSALLLFLYRAYIYFRLSDSSMIIGGFSGILSILVLCFFTYPLKIPSILALLTFFLALISVRLDWRAVFRVRAEIASLLLILIAFIISMSEVNRFKKERAWKEVYDASQRLNWRTISNEYDHAYDSNKTNGDFLFNYGAELMLHGEFRKGIEILSEAQQFIKSSDLFLHLGAGYEGIANWDKAIESYEMASRLIPHKFYPKYRLVYLYHQLGERDKAFGLAQNLVRSPAKVNSEVIVQIKSEMRAFVNQEVKH